MFGRLRVIAFVLLLMSASLVSALERTQVRTTSFEGALWTASNTCAVAYFNDCSGYVWLWSGFADDTEIGMQFENCCGSAGAIETLTTVHWNGAPYGYGFTSMLNVYDDSNGNACPDETPIYSSLFVFTETGAGEEVTNLSLGGLSVGSEIIASITIAQGSLSPANIPTDQGSRLCMPSRANHSYIWGVPESPACPGRDLVAVTETCEFLWSAEFSCAVSVDERSWTSIKALYE